MTLFRNLDPETLNENVFRLIGKEWMLVTAGDRSSFNTMTAAWGGWGIMWQKKCAWCVIRPNRYTFEFMERCSHFTLSFLEEQYKDILTYCGSKSGRDVNKIAETGLTPVFSEKGVYFAEARLVFECRKMYFQDLIPENFLSPDIEELYPLKDYHRMYLGEIISCLSR